MANILIGHVKGPQGDAATVSVGTTTTGAAGSSASVTNSGTSSAAVLNFTIPKGDKGDAGTPGVTDYATTSAAGLVRVGDDFNINSSNGTLSIKNAFTEASTLANISSGESQATILGKVKKFMTTLMPSNFLVNTTNSTATDKALTANMGKTLAGDLATVQTSTTASKAYAVGDFLVLNGKLYKVTASIANGGTITVGTNVVETNAGVQLKMLNDLKPQILPSTITDVNNIQDTSLYCVNSSAPSNYPFTGTYQSYIWTIKANSSLIYQVVFRAAEDIGNVYIRRYISGTWNDWHSLVNTKTATYTCAYTIPANGQVTLTANDFSMPSSYPYQGYQPFALREYITGNIKALPRYISVRNTGSNNVMALTNVSNESIGGTASITVSYVPMITAFT